LADVLTFGIAPTALMYSWAIGPTFTENSPGHNLAVFLLFVYLMCGAFRLARFNLQATRPRVLAEGTPKVDKKAFVGLPIPPAGGLLAALVHFSPMPLSAHGNRSEEHTSELQSRSDLVCRLLLEKKKNDRTATPTSTRINP